MSYIPRFIEPPKESYFLLGPRGTGKSTWLKYKYPKAIRLDLLMPEEERKFNAMPEKLREIALAIPKRGVLVIDEIQRASGLLPVIHSLIEEKIEIQFIMTGSSARKLRRAVGNLLGGRALMKHMPPFFASELKKGFSLEKALQIGLVPMIVEALDPIAKLRNYVGVYLKEEVQAEGLVRQIGDFARFLEIASFSQGNLWNSTQLAREAQIKRTTVDNYLLILQDLLLAFCLPVFTRRAQRALITHPKFYYFDVGIFRSLRPRGPLDSEAEIEGIALESLVAQHLYSWVQAQSENHQFCFWRTRTGLEVDFIIYGPSGFWAFEVKRSAQLSPKDIHGLRSFQEEYPEAKCAVLYGGSIRIVYQNFECIPIQEFLLQIHPQKALMSSDTSLKDF